MKSMVLWVLGLMICTSAWADAEREISVSLSVPDTTWAIEIDMVYQVENELWVIATVSQDPELMGAMVISTVSSSVKLVAGDLPVKTYVLGKTWHWENEEPYTFLKGLNPIMEALGAGKLLYPEVKP